MTTLLFLTSFFGCSSSPIEEPETPFMIACMGKGTESQSLTARALLDILDETRCNAAWKKLKSLKELRLDNSPYPLADLSVLEGVDQLETLYLSDSFVVDIGILKTFKNLRTLRLDHTEISDIDAISALTELETLLLDYNSVTDLKPLSELKNLSTLGLRGTAVSDLTPISGLKKLRYLEASKTDITTIAPLTNLTNLKVLSLRENNLTDIAPLSNLTQLQILDLNGTKVFSLEPISKLTALEALDISHTAVTDLNPLAEMTKLKEFLAVQAPILVADCPASPELIQDYCQKHITPSEDVFFSACIVPERSGFLTQVTIKNLKSALNIDDCTELQNHLSGLETLQLPSTPIPDLSLLSSFNNITSYTLDSHWVHPEYCPTDTSNSALGKLCTETAAKVADSDELTDDCSQSLQKADARGHTFETLLNVTNTNECKNLKEALSKISILHLERLELSDIGPLSYANNLRELYLDYNAITDISSLSKLEKLQILWIDDNKIQDLSPLSNLQLLWLSAGDNQITSVTPLESQDMLINLWLGGNQIQDISPLSKLTKLNKLHLAKNQIQDISPLSKLTKLKKLYLAENQIQDFDAILELPQLTFLSEGLDYEESPLEAHRWFLNENPIPSSKCDTPENLPLSLSLYCYDAK